MSPAASDVGAGPEAGDASQVVSSEVVQQPCKEEARDLVVFGWKWNFVIELDSEIENESEAVDTTSSSSDESGAEFSSARRTVQQPRVPNQLKLVQHKKLKALHLMEMQNHRVMLCGRIAEQARYDSLQETRFDTPSCHICWRKIKEYS